MGTKPSWAESRPKNASHDSSICLNCQKIPTHTRTPPPNLTHTPTCSDTYCHKIIQWILWVQKFSVLFLFFYSLFFGWAPPTCPHSALLQSFWIGFRKRYKLKTEQKRITLNGKWEACFDIGFRGDGTKVAAESPCWTKKMGAWRRPRSESLCPSHRKNRSVITKPMQRPVQGPSRFGICLKNAAHSFSPKIKCYQLTQNK